MDKLEDRVECVDEEGSLRILNYVQCNNESETCLKKMRGVVEEIDTKRVLFQNLPYTDEFVANEFQDEIDLKEWDIYPSVEGALIRVFWHSTRWYISTNKKLNAFNSKWSSRKSFGELFREALVALTEDENILETFLDTLDKDSVYFFLVRYNHENRIVCQIHKNVKENLIFISQWNTKTETFSREWTSSIPVFQQSPITFDTLQDLRHYVQDIDTAKYQGVILFSKSENRQIKILSPTYTRLGQIRNNNPNLRFRYLELRLDPTTKEQIFTMYPTYQDNFLEYEHIIYQIAKLIRYYYVQRYIKNKYVTLPKEEYLLMKKCHEWYLQNREENRINVSKVLDILNTEPPISLYKMIRRFQQNQVSITRQSIYVTNEMINISQISTSS